jgi:hypothetical protein
VGAGIWAIVDLVNCARYKIDREETKVEWKYANYCTGISVDLDYCCIEIVGIACRSIGSGLIVADSNEDKQGVCEWVYGYLPGDDTGHPNCSSHVMQSGTNDCYFVRRRS